MLGKQRALPQWAPVIANANVHANADANADAYAYATEGRSRKGGAPFQRSRTHED